MLKKLSNFIIAFVLVCLLAGCSTESIAPSGNSIGVDYFPLEKDRFIIYDVLEININLSGGDTSRYQLRVLFEDMFTNEAGRDVFVLQNDIRDNDDQEWNTVSLGTAYRTDNGIVVTEDNLPLLKIVFPLNTSRDWDGNTYNAKFPQNFSSTILEGDTTINDMSFVNPARITLADIPENLTGVDQKFELYASDVGLIAKDYRTLEYCTNDCSGEFVIEGGRILRQSILSYGKI